MSTISKLFWAFLAGLVLLWIGGGTPAEAHNQKFTATCETLVIKLDSYQVRKADSFSNVADLEIDGVHYNSYPFGKSTTIIVNWPLADYHDWVLTVDAYNTSDWKHEGPFPGSMSKFCVPEKTVPPTTVPPTTVPPVTTIPPVTTTPPVTTVPPTTVVVATDVPPVPTTTVTPTGALPATGSNATKIVVTLGAIALLCGFALAVAARRPDNNIKLPWRND